MMSSRTSPHVKRSTPESQAPPQLSEHLHQAQLTLGAQRELAELIAERMSVAQRTSLEEMMSIIEALRGLITPLERFHEAEAAQEAELTTSAQGELSRVELSRVELGELPLEMIACEGGLTLHRVGSHDLPAHLSTRYALSKTVITQAHYEEVMGENPSFFKGARHPVERVSWLEAARFCNALSERCGLVPAYPELEGGAPYADPPLAAEGFRLPTPLEWEHAARGGQQRVKYLGVAKARLLKKSAWFVNNAGHKTQEVLTLAPTPLGFDGLAGNVWEWCDARAYRVSAQSEAPQLTSECRGGSFNTSPKRSWERKRLVASQRFKHVGFRVARSLL